MPTSESCQQIQQTLESGSSAKRLCEQGEQLFAWQVTIDRRYGSCCTDSKCKCDQDVTVTMRQLQARAVCCAKRSVRNAAHASAWASGCLLLIHRLSVGKQVRKGCAAAERFHSTSILRCIDTQTTFLRFVVAYTFCDTHLRASLRPSVQTAITADLLVSLLLLLHSSFSLIISFRKFASVSLRLSKHD